MRIGVEINFAPGDLLLRSVVIAKFADAQGIVLGAQRRTEDTASHGTRGVQIAEPGGGIECRTRFVVAEIFKGRVGFIKDAGSWIAGEIHSKARNGLLSAGTNGGAAFRIAVGERHESIAQTGSVKLRDGEDADAALRTARRAFEPRARAASGVGNGSIDDLNKLRVGCGSAHSVKDSGSAAMKKSSFGERMLRGEA